MRYLIVLVLLMSVSLALSQGITSPSTSPGGGDYLSPSDSLILKMSMLKGIEVIVPGEENHMWFPRLYGLGDENYPPYELRWYTPDWINAEYADTYLYLKSQMGTDSTKIRNYSDLLYATNARLSESKTRMSVDTVLIYACAVGIGMPTDTALFRMSYKYPSLYNDGTDTLVITKLIGVVQGTSPDVDVKMQYDANEYDATPTDVNTTALTVTSTTTGSSTTTINNAKIAPATFLWLALTETAAQPTSFRFWAYGYRIKKR